MKENTSMISYIKASSALDIEFYGKGNARLLSEISPYQGEYYGPPGTQEMHHRPPPYDRPDMGNPKQMSNNPGDYYRDQYNEYPGDNNMDNGYWGMAPDDNIQKLYSPVMIGGNFQMGLGNSLTFEDYEKQLNKPSKQSIDHKKGNKYFASKKKRRIAQNAAAAAAAAAANVATNGPDFYNPQRNAMRMQEPLGYDPRMGKEFDSYIRGVNEEPTGRAVEYFDKFEKQSNPFKNEINIHEMPYNYKEFNKQLMKSQGHKSHGKSSRKLKKLAQPGNLLKKKKRKPKGLLVYLIKRIIKAVKRSDAMYETEILNIIIEAHNAEEQEGEENKERGFLDDVKDKLTVMSPIVSSSILLALFALFDIVWATVLSTIIFVLSIIYVWYKYSKCKRLFKKYRESEDQKLSEPTDNKKKKKEEDHDHFHPHALPHPLPLPHSHHLPHPQHYMN
ncbi:Plasmodium exported protein, unknown function [Plasmodium gonderi]|uniref:Pv-fam-d protein n=1 Tax=Plasmodium gonderi TaxID=77519 RepID=A0A1Y1JQW6_PLAGO|nr:Plasmodium exported protein, unknown function [Plasmodium gonderi]GAW83888.1 Plasmodium exported protein, unknown function [Plasmodium gonderi]